MISYEVSSVERQSTTEFGINAFSNGSLVKSVDAITENAEHIQKLAAMFNELEIELCHFEEIIDDYLTDFSI
jgi:hypothetical protein